LGSFTCTNKKEGTKKGGLEMESEHDQLIRLQERVEIFRERLAIRRLQHQKNGDIFAGSECFAITEQFNSIFGET
jgi:hypothetical protein